MTAATSETICLALIQAQNGWMASWMQKLLGDDFSVLTRTNQPKAAEILKAENIHALIEKGEDGANCVILMDGSKPIATYATRVRGDKILIRAEFPRPSEE